MFYFATLIKTPLSELAGSDCLGSIQMRNEIKMNSFSSLPDVTPSYIYLFRNQTEAAVAVPCFLVAANMSGSLYSHQGARTR